MRMVLQRFARGYRSVAQPTAAATLSLVAVTGLTVLVGAFFVPGELRRLLPREHVSVTHYLPPSPTQPGVALSWSIVETGRPGWDHYLVRDGHRGAMSGPRLLDRTFQPLAIAPGVQPGTVLVGNWDGSIYEVDVASPDRAVLLGRQQDGGVMALAASGDGRIVLSQDAFHLYGWDALSRRQLWSRGDLSSACFVLRPNESTAIVSCLNCDLLEIDLATGETRAVLAKRPGFVQSMALSPDGGRLAMVLATGQVEVADSRTLETIWLRDARWSSGTSRFVAISPCGQWLVTPAPHDPHALAVWDAATGEQQRTLAEHTGNVLGATFGESGRLYSFGADGTVRSWNLSQAPLRVARIGGPSPDA